MNNTIPLPESPWGYMVTPLGPCICNENSVILRKCFKKFSRIGKRIDVIKWLLELESNSTQ